MEEDNTEELIFKSATNVFLEKGFDGAKMQEIADNAGINKSLLHYYYRSKEKLFDMVFTQIMNQFFNRIDIIWESDVSVIEKISIFIDNYIDFLMKNPFIPRFIINTIARSHQNAGSVIQQKTGGILDKIRNKFLKLQTQIDSEAAAGKIKQVDAQDLIINTISLMVFPFVAESMIKLIFAISDKEYKNFLLKRKETIKSVVLNNLLINEGTVK